MTKLKNKYLIIVLLLLIGIVYSLFLVLDYDIKKEIYSIFFMLLSIFIFLGELFLYSNLKIKLDKILFFSGSTVINGLYILLTLVFSFFYKNFFTLRQYIILNIILLLVNILIFVIIYNVSKKNEED